MLCQNPAHGLTCWFTLGAGADPSRLHVHVRVFGWLALLASSDATKDAEDAAETAKSWVAKRGRQQFTGDRSSGTPDPGMVAIATILNDLCTEFGVSR